MRPSKGYVLNGHRHVKRFAEGTRQINRDAGKPSLFVRHFEWRIGEAPFPPSGDDFLYCPQPLTAAAKKGKDEEDGKPANHGSELS